MRRILVLRGGALGDFIVTLPALARLRRAWPGARIELAGNATAAQLGRDAGLLDAVHAQHEARWSVLYTDTPLPPDFGAWLAPFDLVVSFWPDPEGQLGRHFPRHPGQRFLSAAAQPAAAPAAAHYSGALDPLGLEPVPCHFSLRPPSSGTPPGRSLVIHPGSGSPRKNWPAERWRALIPLLEPPLALVVGEAETAGWRDFARPGVTVLTGMSLARLADHLAAARLFIGHDSGISHLAAACGVPCLLLFGPTDPARWAPHAPHVRVLQAGPDLAALSVATVATAIAAAFSQGGGDATPAQV
jgi:ADP-heptose:LPS heptosyltransferase